MNKGQTLQEENESLWGVFMSLEFSLLLYERQATHELSDSVIGVHHTACPPKLTHGKQGKKDLLLFQNTNLKPSPRVSSIKKVDTNIYPKTALFSSIMS